MLGNNADQFFTTPMKTTVTTQAGRAANAGNEMPAPRPLSVSATNTASMLPGMGEMDPPQGGPAPVTASMLPGMGECATCNDMLPGMGGLDTLAQNKALWAVAGLGFLFMTKTGKGIRRKIGLA
jgi:hypothetical protein